MIKTERIALRSEKKYQKQMKKAVERKK